MSLIKMVKPKLCQSKNATPFILFALSLFAFSAAMEESGNSINDYLKISLSERTALGKFKVMVRPFLRNNFMKEDIYLIRWLRSKDFNIPQAKQMLLDNLRWRRANNIDQITKEDFSDMHTDYPYSFDARDKYGRPIGSLDIGSWNLRRAALSGRVPRLVRYMTKLLEMNTDAVIDSIYQGKNFTDFKIIANLDGWSVVQHGCPLCMPVYTSFVRTIQSNYPGFTDQFILVNTPPGFKTVLDTIQPLLSTRSRRGLKVFGRNKEQWMKYLEQDISREELDKIIALR